MQTKDLQLKRVMRTALLVLLLSAVGIGEGYAYDFSAVCSTGQTLYYNITDATNHYVALVAPGGSSYSGWNNYTKPTGDIVLPESVENVGVTYTVTSIGNYAFYQCSGLTGSLTIPNSVTLIGWSAFHYCSGFMGDLVIPNSVTTIDSYAFSGCSSINGSLTIGNSVTLIGMLAFSGCSSVSSIISLPETPPTLRYMPFESLSANAFVYVPCGFDEAYSSLSWGGFNNFYGLCSGMVTVIANPEEGGTVTGGGTFEGGELCTVTAIANVGYTFEHWELNGMVVSTSVEYTFIVGGDMNLLAHFVSDDNIVFADANVKSICISHWDINGDGELSYAEAASVTDLGNYFQNNTEITSFEELQYFIGLSSIANSAFSGCSGLTGSLIIPNSVTTIGNSAFESCSGFDGSLTIPNSVTLIGDFAFLYCEGLTGSLTIPNSVTTIGSQAFYYCSGFTSLNLGNAVATIGGMAFCGCTGFSGTLTFPSSVTTVGESAFEQCNFTAVNYTGDLAQWCNISFLGIFNTNPLESAHNLYINGSLVTELIIPETVTVIKDYTFMGGSCFTGSLTIPNTVTTIGIGAFQGCSGFTGELVIPNSVTAISVITNEGGWESEVWENEQTGAFQGCSGIVSISIPNSVISIGSSAFNWTGWYANQPDGIIYLDGCCLGYKGWSQPPGNMQIVEGTRLIANGAFPFFGHYWTGNLTLPESLVIIGRTAFAGCQFTGGLNIPNSVTMIGKGAFSGCNNFDSLVLGSSVTTIGGEAFMGCGGFTSINCLAETPPTLTGNQVFQDCNSNTPVQVPCGSLEAYTDLSWGGFSNFFEDVCFSTITVSSNPQNGGMVEGGGTIMNGETCSLTATANEGYHFVSWTKEDEVVSTEAVYSLTVTEDAEYVANFELNSYEIAATAIPLAGGTIAGAGTYNHFSTATLTATANEGYVFFRWERNGVVVSTDEEYSFVVTGDEVLSASFLSYDNIVFADDSMKSICVAHWDSGGDGELNYVEAAAVTDLGNCFENNAGIISFDELQHFIGLTSVGASAFENCTELTSITLPIYVTSIGNGAFSNCSSLSDSLVIPRLVANIGDQAFSGCSGFTSIVSYAEMPPALGVSTFEGWSPNTLVRVPCGFGEAYASLSWGGFSNFLDMCIYTVAVSASPTAGGTVTGDGQYDNGETCTITATANQGYSFCNWTLNGAIVSTDAEYTFVVTEDVNLVAHFVTAGNIVFHDPNVKAICVAHWDTNGDGELSYLEAALVTDLGNWFQGNTIISSFNELQHFIGLSVIPANAFQGCSGLTSITMPQTIVTIGNSAFSGCTGFFGLLSLPNALVTIGDYAFYNCSGYIGGLTIPNNVTTIGNYAFANCSGFMGLLTIGNSVVTIGNNAFSGCVNFTGNINIPDSVVTIGNEAFYGCTAFWGTLTIGNSVTAIGSSAFYGCTGLVGNIVIPNSVQTIGNHAFYNCHSFAGTLTIGNAVSTIGNNAFRDCYGLTGNIVIPNTVTTIGSEAFRGCTGFAGYLSIGNSVASIGNQAFFNCHNLEGNIEIPNSVTTIGAGAFNNCYGFMGRLTIPSSVTSIGELAFGYCSNLLEVCYNVTNHADFSYSSYLPFQNCGGHLVIGNNVVRIPASMFGNANFIGTLSIPNSVISIADDAFHNCQYITGTLVLPNPLYTIGISAFERCIRLSEIIMGNNVLVVGNTAFKSCTGLTKVTLPYPVTVIGIEAFRDCTSLTEVNMQSMQAPSIGWDVFLNNASGRLINIPCGATPNYSAGYWTEWAGALHEMCGDLVVTVEVNPTIAGSVTGAGTYGYSEMCTLTATGNLGYPFLNWTKNGVVVSTDPVYAFGVTESCTLVANFSTSGFHFITIGKWSTPANWLGGALPTATDEVFIDAPCQLDQNATVTALAVSGGQSLLLQSGKTLTVTGNLSNTVATSLVIEDGAQLIHNVANVQATVRKHITPFSGSDDSWHLIALPLTGSSNVASVTNLLEGEYDLYGYDEATAYWRNQKHTESGFTELETTKGYLYANGEEVILGFSGTLENSSATITVPLSYTDGAHLSGFNLVGNPFPCNAYLNREYYILTTDGTDINPEPIPATTPIPPCTAVFVKAVAVGETVVFTRVVQ